MEAVNGSEIDPNGRAQFLELLEEDKVRAWESIYNDNQGTYNYEEDEE